jgi:hypothetical protein
MRPRTIQNHLHFNMREQVVNVGTFRLVQQAGEEAMVQMLPLLVLSGC